MSWLPVAFLMGFLGSLHCAVMCGPLVVGLPLAHKSRWHHIAQLLLYQLGRTTTYTLLGMLIGLLGGAISLYTHQEAFSLWVGIMVAVFAMLQISGKYLSVFLRMQAFIVKPIAKLMAKIFHLPLWGFFAGFLNGLIPCGMVYFALAAAVNFQDYSAAGKFMMWFGLGTTPLMMLVGVGSIYLKKYFRFNIQKLLPWFMLGLGILLILRACNLGIPFFSPNLHPAYGDVIDCV